MTGLTETEYRTLRMKTLTILGELGARDNATATAIAAGLVSAVEAIVRDHVEEELRRAAGWLDAVGELAARDGDRGTASEVYAHAAGIVREGIA